MKQELKSRVRAAGQLALLLCALMTACHKPMNLEKKPIPGNTLVLEFALPVKYVIDLKIDNESVPVHYGGGHRRLLVEGLTPGKHSFNVHSVSYVYGPEFGDFEVDANKGGYFFIHARQYRAAIPSDRSRVSIRAYRKKQKKEGSPSGNSKGVSAHFL